MTKLPEKILEELPIGVLVFNSNGRVQPGSNGLLGSWLGASPDGKRLSDCLENSDIGAAKVDSWIELIFSGTLEFEECLQLGPRYIQAGKRRLSLEFKPLYTAAADPKVLEFVVVFATDRTEEMRLGHEVDVETQHVKLVLSALRDRTAFAGFIEECRSCIARFKKMAQSTAPDRKALLRELHNLKGLASSYNLTPLVELAHECETRMVGVLELEHRRKLLLDAERLDVELDLMIAKEDLLIAALTEGDRRMRSVKVTALLDFAEQLSRFKGPRTQHLLNDFVSAFALEEFGSLFKRYESLVDNLSRKQGKQVALVIAQTGAPAYCEPYLPLVSACVHVFRNAVDHGIELPAERIRNKKPTKATIRLSFRQPPKTKARIEIIFEDDGRGVDFEAVRSKAVKNGLFTEPQAASLSVEQLIPVLFKSGFTTRENVTEISGRGVGLDALKYEVDQIGGTLRFESFPGKGTRLTLDLPWYRRAQEVLAYHRRQQQKLADESAVAA